MDRRIYLFMILLSVSSCKPVFKVQTETIQDISSAKYKSFKFFNPNDMPASNFAFSDKNKKIIYDAVAAELKTRGFTSIQQSDLIIKIQGGTSQQIKNQPRNSYYDPIYGYNSTYGNPYYWSNNPWMNDDISKKSTSIIIDVLNAHNRKLMWEGVGTGVLGDRPEQVENRIREAIIQIFAKFPIQKKEGN